MADAVDLICEWEDIQLDVFRKFIAYWGFKSKTLERYIKALPGTKEWDDAREDALLTWINYQRRLIPARPRRLITNTSLVCPHEVLQGWMKLQQEVKSGADLTPRLSSKIENTDYNDGILNDFGLHHFHLGTVADVKHPKQVQRTSIILLACVSLSEFYPIDFVPHKHWGDETILEKAIESFHRQFDRYSVKGLSDSTSTCDNENIVKFRNDGVNYIHKIGKKLYFSPGMGVTTAGTSFAATIILDQIRRRLIRCEKQLCEMLNAQQCSGMARLVRSHDADNSLALAISKQRESE